MKSTGLKRLYPGRRSPELTGPGPHYRSTSSTLYFCAIHHHPEIKQHYTSALVVACDGSRGALVCS